MSFTVQKLKRRAALRPEQELRRRLSLALKAMLTPATFVLESDPAPADAARAGVPDLSFIHDGRAFYLKLMAPHAYLTAPQRAAHVALRDAGARVEVARSVPEALAHIRSFGIPLRDIPVQWIFRSAA